MGPGPRKTKLPELERQEIPQVEELNGKVQSETLDDSPFVPSGTSHEDVSPKELLEVDSSLDELDFSHPKVDTIDEESVPSGFDETVLRLSSRRRSRVVDVGVALPDTFGHVIIEETDEPNRRLSVPISLDQASMIAAALLHLPRRRPLLADVVSDLFDQFSMTIAMISITGRQGGVFLAEVTVVDSRGQQRTVPSRLSDAILLGLASPIMPPLMVSETLFG